MITLVHDGDECLLCRQSRWPPGMHSTLAGFLEPGESLEECVAREIEEESGIKVGDIRYHSSQPWPSPGTIMVGFMAQALTREIAVDEIELEYAHWYERRDLLGQRDTDAFRLPGRYSISRRLIEGLARRPYPALVARGGSRLARASNESRAGAVSRASDESRAGTVSHAT